MHKWANEGSGWQFIPNKPQYLSEYREILEALKRNTWEMSRRNFALICLNLLSTHMRNTFSEPKSGH